MAKDIRIYETNRGDKRSISTRIKEDLLKNRLQRERSKHSDKMQDKEYIRKAGDDFDKTRLLEKQYFYSEKTYIDCVKTASNFVSWARQQGLANRKTPIKEYEQHIEKYIENLIEKGEKTPRTIAKERSQLGKVWLVDTDRIPIPPCTAESQKGRSEDRYYNMNSENHSAATEFYKMIGARKGEYKFLNQQEFRQYKDQVKEVAGIELKTNSDGQCPNIYPVRNTETGLIDKVVVIHAKHGKTNISEILPKHQEEVTRIFQSQEYRNYLYPSDHCNVHSCRRAYAQELYRHYSRDVMELPRHELYICKDGSHRMFDREALSIVAQSLGHAPDDLFDTVHNYMR